MICGSDYPFPLGEDRPGELVEASAFLSSDDKSKILWRNGLDWLGVSETEAVARFARPLPPPPPPPPPQGDQGQAQGETAARL